MNGHMPAKSPEVLAQERITIDPAQCSGKPCIRGLRIRVTDVLGMLAAGMTHAEVLADFPYLEEEDIVASLSYASQLTDRRTVSVAHAQLSG
jgi:uncharacterized protein (DUF433 family)